MLYSYVLYTVDIGFNDTRLSNINDRMYPNPGTS